MDSGLIIQLMETLQTSNIREYTEWVMCSCPFAFKTHENGQDRHPSFGISISDGLSVYNCFACGAYGKLTTLPLALKYSGHPKAEEAARFISKYEKFFVVGLEKKNRPDPKIMPEISECMIKELVIPAKWGKITRDSIEKWELYVDIRRKCVVFALRDEFGRLVGLKRRYRNKQFAMEAPGLLKHGYWYGVNLINSRTIYLVEGERDAILLTQAYPEVSAIASLGSNITAAQVEYVKKLYQKGHKIICFFDNDSAGRKATKSIIDAGVKASVVLYFGVNVKDPAEAVEKNLIENLIEKSVDKK